MSRDWGPALALGLGLLASTNFDPWSVPGTFVLAVAGLLALLRRRLTATRRRHAATTALFGLGLMAPGIWWMNAVSPAAWVGLVIAQVGFFAMLGLGLRQVVALPLWPLWIASMWTAIELVRGLVPFGGFPWLRLAHTSLDTPMESFTRYLGLAGTSWLLALLAALLVLAFERRSVPAVITVAAVTLIGMALPTGIAGAGDTLTVAAIQGDTPGSFNAWPRGAILRMHAEETERLSQPVDLVIWPENASDLDVQTNPHARQLVTSVARRVDAPILVGAILDGPTDSTARNASVVVDADGPHQEIYLKQHVVPWGEYVPFRQQLGPLVPRLDRDIPRDLLAGDEPGEMHVAGTVVGTVICWDVAHDAAIHGSVEKNASFIAVQTSNASFADFGRGTQPEQQWDISRLRAIETGRWVVVASTNGVSGIIDPQGRVVERLPVKQAATSVQKITLATSTTWASHVSVPLSWLLGALALSGWGFGAIRRRKDRS